MGESLNLNSVSCTSVCVLSNSVVNTIHTTLRLFTHHDGHGALLIFFVIKAYIKYGGKFKDKDQFYSCLNVAWDFFEISFN